MILKLLILLLNEPVDPINVIFSCLFVIFCVVFVSNHHDSGTVLHEWLHGVISKLYSALENEFLCLCGILCFYS